MKLYMAINLNWRGKRIKMSTVYHLREDCHLTNGPNTDVVAVSESTVKRYVNDYGIKRICLACRKAVEASHGIRATGKKAALKRA